MDDYIVVMSAVPTREAGLALADFLVKGRLAACVNIVPGLTSVYEWKDKLCVDDELLLLIKTRKVLFDKVRDAIRGRHPYELPEIIALPVEGGLQPYLEWISGNTLDS